MMRFIQYHEQPRLFSLLDPLPEISNYGVSSPVFRICIQVLDGGRSRHNHDIIG